MSLSGIRTLSSPRLNGQTNSGSASRQRMSEPRNVPTTQRRQTGAFYHTLQHNERNRTSYRAMVIGMEAL
ncbi:hypothetical protein CYLTODRAFT_425858, partial [Cylindrobasidium torrendii FP15055 ss-10]